MYVDEDSGDLSRKGGPWRLTEKRLVLEKYHGFTVCFNMIVFPYIGNNNPNWRTHIFQRDWNQQPWFFSYHVAWVPVNCTTNPNDWPLGTVGFCNHGIKRGCKPSNDGDWTKNSQLEPQVLSTKSGWWGYWWRLKTCFGLFLVLVPMQKTSTWTSRIYRLEIGLSAPPPRQRVS